MTRGKRERGLREPICCGQGMKRSFAGPLAAATWSCRKCDRQKPRQRTPGVGGKPSYRTRPAEAPP